ncbi:MAG: type III pantothenate kinase [Armatimonadetes bacterium]|nr:type III pantothenate kinase [Armatimonadota bacterium]
MSGRVLFGDIGNTVVKLRLRDGGHWRDLLWGEPGEATEKTKHLLGEQRPSALVMVASAPVRALLDTYPICQEALRELPIEETGCRVLALVAQLADVAGRACTPCLVAGRDFPVSVPTAYHDPGELGVDRLCAAFAASHLFGVPVVTASAGTCLTVEAVDERGVLVGGAIAAGVGAMARGIIGAVPHLECYVDAAVRAGVSTVDLGRSTAENLVLGLWLGAAATLDRLIAAARAVVGMKAPVVLTGGDAHKLAPLCQTKVEIFEHLVLEGLRLAYETHLSQGPD